MTQRLWLPLSLLFLSLAASPARAGLLDQSYEPGGTNAIIISSIQTPAQTFTVGRSGLLSRVEVEVARNPLLPPAGITLEIRPTLPDRRPASTVLASAAIPATAVSTTFDFLSVDLSSAGLPVTDGDLLAIVLTTTAPATGSGGINPYAWLTDDFPGTYARGDTFIAIGGSGFVPTLFDYGFRTYVTPAGTGGAVPQLSSGLLLGVGGLTLWILRRRWARGAARVKEPNNPLQQTGPP